VAEALPEKHRRSRINIGGFAHFPWPSETFSAIIVAVAIDRRQLPESAEVLQQMVIDLIAQLDATQARCEKTEHLLRQLLAARSGRGSERLSEDQLALFETEWKAQTATAESPAENDNKEDDPPATPGETPKATRAGAVRFPDICNANASCTIWPSAKNTARPATKTCGGSARKSASATNISRRRCW
jgi:hypothetical protein